jgi:hypothetical protein
VDRSRGAEEKGSGGDRWMWKLAERLAILVDEAKEIGYAALS